MRPTNHQQVLPKNLFAAIGKQKRQIEVSSVLVESAANGAETMRSEKRMSKTLMLRQSDRCLLSETRTVTISRGQILLNVN